MPTVATAGRDGRGIVSRGTFDATAEYQQNNLVACNGASWIALHDNPGVCPGNGWQLVASPGKRGVPGQKGDRGERGPKGEQGERGFQARVYERKPVLGPLPEWSYRMEAGPVQRMPLSLRLRLLLRKAASSTAHLDANRPRDTGMFS